MSEAAVAGIVPAGSELVVGQEPELGPGIRGYVTEVNGELYIPLVFADRPGTGDMGRYLDSLPRDRVIKFPDVLSTVLAAMLDRRGFRREVETDYSGEDVEVWARRPDLSAEVERLRSVIAVAAARLNFDAVASAFEEQMKLPGPGTEISAGSKRWTPDQFKEAAALWSSWFDREVQMVQVMLLDALEGLK